MRHVIHSRLSSSSQDTLVSVQFLYLLLSPPPQLTLHADQLLHSILTAEIDKHCIACNSNTKTEYLPSRCTKMNFFSKLKLNQNKTAACLVTNHRNATSILRDSTCCLLSTVLSQKPLHWLKNIAIVVPGLFKPSLPRSSCPYSTRCSLPDQEYLVVQQPHSSFHKSVKHFGNSCAVDAPVSWNDLPECVCNAEPLLPLSRRSSNLICLQKPIHLSHPVTHIFPVMTWLCQ